MKKIVLLLGGARSGKSQYAQELAGRTAAKVLFVATATAGDADMRRRIQKHRSQRPREWRTLEVPNDVGSRIQHEIGDARLVIIDCITLLVNNIFCQFGDGQFETLEDSIIGDQVDIEIEGLLNCLRKTDADFIIVSNEVGLGLVPDNRMGRLYRDFLGRANQKLAQCSTEVYLMVSGIPLRVKPQLPARN